LQGTRVSVVLADESLSNTFAVRAGIIGRACVAIGALLDVVQIDTAQGRIASVVCADISIVT
jgi:hypothetical protein